MIYIAPVQILTTCDVIKFVAKNPVREHEVGKKMEQDGERREIDEQRGVTR
jgi:hypothetical protein